MQYNESGTTRYDETSTMTTIKANPVWMLTGRLRWAQRKYSYTKVLQQELGDTHGSGFKWVDVPVVEEPDEASEPTPGFTAGMARYLHKR